MLTIYGKPNCPNCETAKSWLLQKGVPYEYIDVSVNATALTFLRESGARSVPEIYHSLERIGGLEDLRKYLLTIS